MKGDEKIFLGKTRDGKECYIPKSAMPENGDRNACESCIYEVGKDCPVADMEEGDFMYICEDRKVIEAPYRRNKKTDPFIDKIVNGLKDNIKNK